MEPSVERIPLSTGISLNVARQGPPDALPFVLLPAYADSWWSWSRVLSRLGAERQALAIDPRGHGDSDRPACCYGVDDVVKDVIATLDATGVDRAIIAGHSGSCFAARRLAVLHPDRVAALALIASPLALDREALGSFVDAVEALADPVPEAFVRDFQSGTTHRRLPDSFLDGIVEASLKVPARVWRDTLVGLLAFRDEGDLGRVLVPTTLIWGERDTIVDRDDQDRQRAAIPNARLEILAGTGHSANWEAPEEVAKLLLELAGRAGSA
jgi:pimeloyl-ACP methyl ester carboxylesterase